MGGGGWWWFRPILVFSLSLDQAEQKLINLHLAHESWGKILAKEVKFPRSEISYSSLAGR